MSHNSYEDIIFKDDEIVFHADDASTHAFYISKGNVDLYHLGKKVYTAGVGEFIGQSGVISGKKYGLTAKTVGQSRIQKIEKHEFLSLVQDDPVVAANVVKNMSAQIYNNQQVKKVKPRSNDLTADINKLVDDFNYHRPAVTIGQKTPGRDLVIADKYDSKSLVAASPNLIEMSPVKKSFVSFLSSFVTGVGSSLIDDNPITIAVPRIENDVNNNMYQKWLVSVVEGIAKIKIIKPKISLSLIDEFESFRKSYDIISQYNADLVIWGGIDDDARLLTLKFSSTIPGSDFMGNAAKNTLYIPLQGGDGLYSLLRAPVMSNDEIISNMVCLGNASYTFANSVGRADFYRKAKEIYNSCMNTISPTDDKNYFILQKQLGQINQNISEKVDAYDSISESIKHFEAALSKTPKDINPLAWAELEYSIAQSYQQKAILGGNEDDFSKSIASYQSVLEVFGFDNYPIKWAEVMNSIGKTLQVYGEVYKDMDALKRAVKMYRQALMVRSKEMYPLLWANTQNNLGSVLFLLARHVKDNETLNKAIESFNYARDIYDESGAIKMLVVVEKNLVRAEAFKKELRLIRK